MNRLLSACCLEESMLFPCSYLLKERNLVQMCSIRSSEGLPYACGTIESERYISKPLHMLCIKNSWSVKYASFPSFDIFNFEKIKHDNLNQMSGLKENFVIPFSKQISSSQNLRNYSSHQKK
jgi:hypothetical protein